MTTYRCRKGCVQGDPPRPVYHAGRWECPKEEAFDAGKAARYRERREKAKAALRGAGEAPPATPADTNTPPPKPGEASTPQPGTSTALRNVEFGTRTAETARREAQAKDQAEDWELPSESAETFFGTVRNWFRMFANFMDDVLDAEHTKEGRIKQEIFELNQHDLAAARGGFGRRLATKVVKALGAKTLQQGIETIDSLAFVTMFGVMFLTMIIHFFKVAEDSPRLKKLRESAAKAKAERAAAKEAAGRLSAEQKAGAIGTTATPAGGAG